MIIATWNVNSIRARLPSILKWLSENQPDVLLLQEIKTISDGFPTLEIEDLGYNIAAHGQKTYNGVAILSKRPLEDVSRGLPGDKNDDQARYIEAVVDTVRVASIYLPNGNPTDSDKYPYKLAWMDRLIAHVKHILSYEEAIVLGGDYNIIPEDRDCYDPVAFGSDALCLPESRARWRQLQYLGLTEAFRARHPDNSAFSYWDYQGGAWQKDHGLRIDHFLLSPQAADRLGNVEIDSFPRGKERPSDHTPVWCEILETV